MFCFADHINFLVALWLGVHTRNIYAGTLQCTLIVGTNQPQLSNKNSHNYPFLDSKSNHYKASHAKNFQPKFAHQANENINNQLTKHVEKWPSGTK